MGKETDNKKEILETLDLIESALMMPLPLSDLLKLTRSKRTLLKTLNTLEKPVEKKPNLPITESEMVLLEKLYRERVTHVKRRKK